jgi:hypothetical protein
MFRRVQAATSLGDLDDEDAFVAGGINHDVHVVPRANSAMCYVKAETCVWLRLACD